MKLRAFQSVGMTLQRLSGAGSALREAAIEAAAEVLRGELQQRTDAVISVRARPSQRAVGTADTDAAAHEFGTLTQSPSPWLAPALPLAREAMRAAAAARVRDTVAAHAGKNKVAAARAVSALAKRKN